MNIGSGEFMTVQITRLSRRHIYFGSIDRKLRIKNDQILLKLILQEIYDVF